jgi:hypothetical protein
MIKKRQNVPEVFDPNMFSDDIIKCHECKKGFYSKLDTDKIYFLNDCLDSFCRACLARQIVTDYVTNDGQVKCKNCRRPLLDYDIKVNIKKINLNYIS